MSNYVDKICLVVTATSREAFLTQLEKAQALANLIELRLDYLPNLNKQDLEVISQKTYKNAIICVRATAQGGKFTGSIEAQNQLLQHANDLGFAYLDIDYKIAGLIKINNQKSKIILSYHDFEKTPDINELTCLQKKMAFYSPDILKFAVQSNSEQDTQHLIEFLTRAHNLPLIVLGMGEHGKKLRLLAPLLGGYLTFASFENKTSAPGQLAFDQMAALYNSITSLIEENTF